jgi:dephospho-CoA kinase
MILGITGISGTGKHTAAKYLLGSGEWEIFDADKIAHQLYRPYTYVWKAIVKRFGEGILTNGDLIDRQKLRTVVFDADRLEIDSSALIDLNNIIHPAVLHYLEERIHYHHGHSNIIIIGALWHELNLFNLCDKVLLIASHQDASLMRVKKRDGIDEAMYLHYTRNQSSPEKADFVVENNGTLQQFHAKLDALHLP